MPNAGDIIKITDSTLAKMISGSVSIQTSDWTLTAGTPFYGADYYRAAMPVTFPAGLFTAVPAILVTAESSVPGVLMECSYSSPATTGFTLRAARNSTTATSVNWIAIQIL